jgi:hypothetical protein
MTDEHRVQGRFRAEWLFLDRASNPRHDKDVPMLALLITSALAASLLVELGLSVVRDLMEAPDQEFEDERQMNKVFKRTSGTIC